MPRKPGAHRSRVLLLSAVSLVVLPGLAHAQQTVGLFMNTDDAYDGFTLFAPQNLGTTFLIDNAGRQVHTWDSAFLPGNTA